MSDNCTHDCSSCGEACASREGAILKEAPHQLSSIKKVIAVVSGKGGVGKSLITSVLAVNMNRLGYKTAVLDADITGPSIPKAFGVTGSADGSDMGIFPLKSKMGIRLLSINNLLAHEDDPVIWRGPMIAGVVKQFWTDVIWGDVDFMFIDMPPGTGDVPLTVFQSIPLDGIIIAATPQKLVEMIVSKAVKMAKEMNIPVIGIVENMAYYKCPDCNAKHNIFGESNLKEFAKKEKIGSVSEMPLDPKIAAAADKGLIELYEGDYLSELTALIEKL